MPVATKRERAPPWPPDWFEMFQARYPKREAWGRAEKVLERIRRAGKIPFEKIMAGVERLVERIARGELQPHFACQPGKWLDGRGWEDEPEPSRDGSPPRGGAPPHGPRLAHFAALEIHTPFEVQP